MNENTVSNDKNKISVSEFIDNKSLLEVSYLPFDSKMQLVSTIFSEVINVVGGLNTALLRRISTEAFINAISNIDMSIKDDTGLDGFDQLYYHREFKNLVSLLGEEYTELQTILTERLNDYIRTETNPAITINSIYEQVKTYFNTALDYISTNIQNIDVEKLTEQLSPLMEKVGGINEG